MIQVSRKFDPLSLISIQCSVTLVTEVPHHCIGQQWLTPNQVSLCCSWLFGVISWLVLLVNGLCSHIIMMFSSVGHLYLLVQTIAGLLMPIFSSQICTTPHSLNDRYHHLQYCTCVFAIHSFTTIYTLLSSRYSSLPGHSTNPHLCLPTSIISPLCRSVPSGLILYIPGLGVFFFSSVWCVCEWYRWGDREVCGGIMVTYSKYFRANIGAALQHWLTCC